jgi:hypothetical protein
LRRGVEFVRVDCCRDEKEAVQPQLFQGVLREQEMAVVHGVEAASKKAYALGVQSGGGFSA